MNRKQALALALLATIILAVRAARHIPKFDKDYILILGCKILKDGSLPKLLQSRADRSVEFAKMQKEATGKDLVFVPSGGKGSDEVISEADAVANYLRSLGIPTEGIGAPTKRYYWINAFIREFIATIRYEWKAHLTVILFAFAGILIPIILLYLNNNL